MFFAGGSYFDWFPLRGLVSEDWESLGFWDRIVDYLWHIFLPVLAMTIGGFATTSLLTKNAFLDDQKQYVMTARAKGLSEARVLYGHVFRNAMLIVIAGFPAHLSALFLPAHCLLKRFSRSMGSVFFPMKASSTAIIRWCLPRFIFLDWWVWWSRSSPT